MSDNFFKVKNGLNLPNYTGGSFPTLSNPAAGDLVFYNGKLYIYDGNAWGVKPGSGSTGLIVNADVDNAAAIAGTKVSPDFGSQNVTTSGSITATGAGTITSAGTLRTNAQLQVYANGASEAVYIQQLGAGNALVIEDSANPDTTSLVVDASGNTGIGVNPASALVEKLTVAGDVKVTTGDIKLDTAKGIESSAAASTLNIGTGTNTQTLNLGTGSGTQTVNIGTGAGVTTINIGGTGDSVVIAGTLTTVNTTNLDVADKNITLNKGGLAGSANGSGISIEAGGSSVASLTFDQTDGGAQPQNTFTLSGTGSLALPSGTTAQRPNTPANGMIRYNSTNGAFEGYASNAWSGIGGGGTIDKVTQASHGFVVGDVLYINGSTYAKARADVAATAEVVGMVSRVIDASNFELTLNGEVSGLTGLTMGENYFLSAATAGAITATEPSVVGQISLPIGVASSTTTLYVAPKRGATIGGANVRTSITLANNATTNVQNVSAYEAGELTGWVTISASTPLRFFVRASFARNGAASDYNLSYQTTGDTPPAGFSMGITAAGVITATLPTVTGYSTASINFALNAPAVGATLPLQISGGNVTGPVLGSTSGVAPAAGYVGNTIVATFSGISAPANGTIVDLTSLSLSPGTWMIFGKATFNSTATTASIDPYFAVGINITSATETGATLVIGSFMTGIATYRSVTCTTVVTTSLASPNVYLTIRHGATTIGGATISGSGSGQTASYFYAVRIA